MERGRLTRAVGALVGALLVAGCGGAGPTAADAPTPLKTPSSSAPGSPSAPSATTASPSAPESATPEKPGKTGKTAKAARQRTGAAGRVPRRMILVQLRNRAERIAQSLPSSSPNTLPADVDPDSHRALGHRLLLEFGFDAEQWPYLDALWQRESGWNHLAENPKSGAYGIPQSLPATKMRVAGADWRTNPETQIMWGLAYIAARYGQPERAWAHSERVNWY